MVQDDPEAALAALEQRLRALQAELDDEPASPGTDPHLAAGSGMDSRLSRARTGTEPHLARARRGTDPDLAVPVRPPVPADPLEVFGSDLRRLVSSFDRMLAELRGPPTAAGYVFTGDVAIDASVSFDGLCSLGRALADVPAVRAVELRAYAGGRAALDVVLERPVALVEELRGRIRTPLSLVEAREGRLVLDVG